MTTRTSQTINGVEVRTFSIGKANIGDSFKYAIALQNVPKEKLDEELQKIVPQNETALELLSDIRSHKCSSPKITGYEDERRYTLGFVCECCSTRWEIPLRELKECAVHHPEIKEDFCSRESRCSLSEKLTKELNKEN